MGKVGERFRCPGGGGGRRARSRAGRLVGVGEDCGGPRSLELRRTLTAVAGWWSVAGERKKMNSSYGRCCELLDDQINDLEIGCSGASKHPSAP